MRVALVCPYDLEVPGGVQSHVRHLARELCRTGDAVLVVAPGRGARAEDRGEPGTGDGAAAGGTGEVVTVGPSLGVPFNGSVAPLALSPAAGRCTLEALRRFVPDVVHVHEPAAPLTSLVASLRAPAPVVGTFHAWSERAALYRLARPLLRPLASRLAARIAVSPAAVDYHARALGIPAGSFRIVPNGVDVGRFAAAEPADELARGEAPTVLFVGRLEPRKGLEPLVRAFITLKSTRPALRLVVVGEGPERDRCQRLLPAGLRADVLFLGRVGQEDLPRFYAACDLLVSPALSGESFGIVLLEAMAAGRPVVASDLPGYRSVLRDGVEGRLVPPGDVPALAQALEALLANPALRHAMGKEGRATAAAYNWPVVAARIREVYLRATGREHRPAGESR